MNYMEKQMNLSLALYQKLYLIRRATQVICWEYPSDQIKTPVHLSMGEEAISVGICHALGQRAQFCGTYRNHGLYLSLTLETDKFFAELYGKKTGVAGGKAGSMHLTASEQGLIATSAVVGTTIPVAVGAAFANQVLGNEKTIVVFFGDGALNEGAFWESFNAACAWRLPMIFVCEDNGLATHTKKTKREGYDHICSIIPQFRCNVLSATTTDVEEIYQLALKAKELVENNSYPVFVHLDYYRYLEHTGTKQDFDKGYRDRGEFEKWFEVDPVKLQRGRLVKNFGLELEILEMEKNINEQIEKSVQLAKEAEFPEKVELFKGVLA